MVWSNFYSDFIINLFCFLTLNLFINSFAKCINKKQQLKPNVFFVCLFIVFSLVPEIPYYTYISYFIDLIYVLVLVQGSFKTRFITFIKYELYFHICTSVVGVLYAFFTIFTINATIYSSNITFARYSNIICYFFLYVVLNVFIIIRNLSLFPKGKMYKHYFIALISSMVLLLLLCPILLDSNVVPQEDVLPFMITLLLIITLLCITIYRRIIDILEENTLAKIEAQTNALQQDYYAHIENNLKTLSSLRHDFKNHLLILDGYARAQETEKLLDYIQTIHQTYESANLIQTPSTVLSALLNAKNEKCRLKGVSLSFTQSIPEIVIDDFYLVTIMSNLLDNAITAAAKCPNGTITLQMIQLDSHLEIDCVNSHQEKLLPKGDIFLTTKEHQKEIHGLGITSMRKTVEALYGNLSIDYTDDTFHVAISVPNYR